MRMGDTGLMRILQVNTADEAGGAERVMMSLHGLWAEQGLASEVAVGYQRGTNPAVRVLAGSSLVRRAGKRLLELSAGAARRGWDRTAGLFSTLATCTRPGLLLGHEDFGCNGAREILLQGAAVPDVLHLHNLHGGYFDLCSLPQLCQRLPVVMTLHDGWLFSGHCAHGIDCDRWKSGCGSCPDLAIYPGIRRDATAWNWKRKAAIFSRCRLNVITPCQWLMDRARQSMLWPAVARHAVIPNGVDLTIFRQGQRAAARGVLGIPRDQPVVMFAANGIRSNPFKDYRTLRACLELVGQRVQTPTLALAIGDTAPTEQLGRVELRFVAFASDAKAMARFYAAANVYLHLARIDTFPNTILEAMATGLPVVGSDVGGIGEQVRSISASGPGAGSLQPTGILVKPGCPETAAQGVLGLLKDPSLAERLGAAGRATAEKEYCIRLQADRYLAFYRTVL